MIHLVVVFAFIFAAVYEKPADAAQASVSYLHGDGYASGDATRNTLRLDALTIKNWGMLYGRVDVLSFDDRNSSVVTRGIGHYGKGLHFSGQLQNQRGVSQSSAGFGYSSFGKNTSWFVDLYRMSSNYYGDSSHAFGYASQDWENWQLSGWVEVIQPDKNFQPNAGSQISLTYKIGEFRVGVEQQRYINKNGIKGLDEVVNQGVIKWIF
jgi:hypothetical protein